MRIECTAVEAELDAEARTIAGLIVPWGHVGNTSIGPTTFAAGSMKPADIVLNLQHDRTRPIGRSVEVSATEAGLVATFKIAATTAGNDALVEAAEGLRAGLSIEAEILESQDIDGVLVVQAAELTGCGLVTRPAFAAAQVEKVAAEESDQETAEVETLEESEVMDAEKTEGTPVLTAGAGPKAEESLPAVLAQLAEVGSGRAVEAALSDLKLSSNISTIPPTWVGELWAGQPYERQIIPLFGRADLRGPKVQGWRWKVAPAVAAYAGDKGAVASNAATTEAYETSAKRLAGAHDIDRALYDFGDSDYWAAYWRAMAASYALQSDLTVLSDVTTAATKTTSTANPFEAFVDGCLAVAAAANTGPTFAIAAPDVYKKMLTVTAQNTPAFASGTFGFIFPAFMGMNASIPAGKVLVGHRNAVTVRELAGSPIRAEVANIANGGIDAGVFGYVATEVHMPTALQLVTLGTT